ncbi:MAG: alanine:cation symporter family protein, partial [Deltaproteobacteria bacterium]|nr:alanine:cation symporter family protein [Deltaproteobacteria bacterium]
MEFLKQFDAWADTLSGHVWGIFGIIPLLIGTGIFLMIGLKFLPLLKIGPALKTMWRGRKAQAGHEGELTPWQALMASLAATVGTGNIVGVATAIYFGGPGAVFWMWVTGFLGMGTKFCEATLAVKYREVAADGSFIGGPMYYIKNGLGEKWKWMATLFAILGSVACFGIGNMTQA